MSDEADASLKQHPDWKKARLVWAATGKDLPGKPGKNDLHYLAELKAAAGSYLSAKEITLADREREWTPDQVANQCEALAQVLYQLDDAMFARLAGASLAPTQSIIPKTIANLHTLEAAYRNAQMPTLPHKRKQEHNDFLVIILAEIYERHTHKRASVYTERTSNERVGPFVEFVEVFCKKFLSGEITDLNARAIQRALKRRADSNPPSSL